MNKIIIKIVIMVITHLLKTKKIIVIHQAHPLKREIINI